MAKFFAIPFASSAAKTTIPDTDNESVSWRNGYTAFYEYDPTAKDSKAKHIERDNFNTLLYEITSSIRDIQLAGIAPYYDAVIATSGPGYSEGSVVTYANKIWVSKKAGNKIKPNATTTANWEELYGYDTLVARLKKDSYIGASSSGGGTTSGYTKTEIDDKIKVINQTMNDYLYKELGEIFLLSWCDEDRNAEGFFLCNGDKLPYTLTTATDEKTFHGNQLYSLCYTTSSSGTQVESDFKKRWNIQIDTANKTIALPNILNTVASTQTVMLGMNKDSGVTDVTKLRYFSSGEVTTEAEKLGNIVYRFNLLPCVYLGNYGEED